MTASVVDRSFEYVVVGLGALGSATAYQLARRGHRVLGLEQFELGHARGASHDTSRILRHSYHTPGYVTMTLAAYDDWRALEADSGEQLVTQVGGLDLFPPAAAIPVDDYTTSMSACGVPYDVLDEADVAARWPQFSLPTGTVALYQDRASIVPAGRGTAVLQAEARRFGAELRDSTAVGAIEPSGGGVLVRAGDATYSALRVIVCADAWTNRVLEGVGVALPLTVTLEQVTYFRPADARAFQPGRLPLWIWMDDPSYYGFPSYGEPTVKAARDCSGIETTGDDRRFDPDPAQLQELRSFMAATLPGAGPAVRSTTCLYTLTPDRDFVLGPVPGCESVLVGLGAGHAFKFAPTVGRLLVELATTNTCSQDVSPFALDRDALTKPDQPVHWLV
ncbi:MAG: N-methyl-L-tryptophan oxidase [Nocardioidaceae bacterium]